MAYGDIRDDWKLRDIESKADRANDSASRASHEASQAQRDVDRLEHTVRQLSSLVDELRYEREETSRRLSTVEETLAYMNGSGT